MKQQGSISSKIKRGISSWMVPPASSWRRKSKNAFLSAGLFWPLNLLLFSLVLMVGLTFLHLIESKHHLAIATAQGLILPVMYYLCYQIIKRIKLNLLDPLTHMRHWAMRTRGGHLMARIPLPEDDSEFKELAKDINSLSDSLQNLTHNMKEQVRIQTQKTAQKSQSLKVLYDVATHINNSQNIEDLLTRFMGTLQKLVDAKAACIRLLTSDNQLKLIASTGLSESMIKKERLIPVSKCECGKAVINDKMKYNDVENCGKLHGQALFDEPNLKMIAVPLKHRGKTLGIYNLFVDANAVEDRDDLNGLLNSIGQHLGMAIAKSQLEKEAQRLALMEERTLLSHELHDSLAQTLASLKFQVSIINETLEQSHNTQAQSELNRLKQGLDKAYSDLRELLNHFRTPMDARGLVPALKDMSNKLQKETGIAVFFQDATDNQTLDPSHEVQVLHIVQEALSNIRKHSQAHNARVLLKVSNTGTWCIIIEDDGVGLQQFKQKNRPGENIGLLIMQERAEYLGGTISFDSEEGEGTRIELCFTPKPEFSLFETKIEVVNPQNSEAVKKVSQW